MSCDGGGDVKYLQLRSNNLVGGLPAEIGLLNNSLVILYVMGSMGVVPDVVPVLHAALSRHLLQIQSM